MNAVRLNEEALIPFFFLKYSNVIELTRWHLHNGQPMCESFWCKKTNYSFPPSTWQQSILILEQLFPKPSLKFTWRSFKKVKNKKKCQPEVKKCQIQYTRMNSLALSYSSLSSEYYKGFPRTTEITTNIKDVFLFID